MTVELDAAIEPDHLDAPSLKPDAIRYLEILTRLAEAGDVAALRKAGTVYVRLEWGKAARMVVTRRGRLGLPSVIIT